ncbi:MAG TPA: peroxidase family protein, partial [Acidimicrobiia bacterium]
MKSSRVHMRNVAPRLRRPGAVLTSIALLLGVTAMAGGSASGTNRPPIPGRSRPTFPSGSRPPISGGSFPFEARSLDGSGNNERHPTWGQANLPYSRVARAAYADGRSAVISGPNDRYISNRVFNDVNQNVFNDRNVSQWGNVWGQFLDHTFGLAQDGTESSNIPFNAADPLESFQNDFGVVGFTRSAAAPGTGVTNARQSVNTVNSYISGWPVYGGTTQRLEWLREGPVDGNMNNNGPHLMLDNGYLPRADARGNAATAPTMAVDGRLLAAPQKRMEAGDVRANENIALTATHTLFAREHNRIVDALPANLPVQLKFEIARRVVGAEEQYVTYNEFLPAMGVNLNRYTGYNPNVDTTLSNEFATVGYRAHSMVHGEIEVATNVSRYTAAQLDAFRTAGIEVTVTGADVKLVIPL